MLGARFTHDIPDELPQEILDDPEQAIFCELFQQLKQEITRIQEFRDRLANEHGILFPTENEPIVRLNVLIGWALGRLTEARMNFELEWNRVLLASFDAAYEERISQKLNGRSKRDFYLADGTRLEFDKEVPKDAE